MPKFANTSNPMRRMVIDARRLKSAVDRGNNEREKKIAADMLAALLRVQPIFDPVSAVQTAANSGE